MKKRCDYVVVDPGPLTMSQLQYQMRNPKEIPFWQMHPLVQHCLRMYEYMYPHETVEWKSKDACGWVDNIHSSANMIMEKYRIKKGVFTREFIQQATMFNTWNAHRNS